MSELQRSGKMAFNPFERMRALMLHRVRRSQMPSLIVWASVFCWLLTAATSLAGVHFSVTDLGTLPGKTSSEGYDANNAGQVTGVSSNGTGDDSAFLYGSGSRKTLGVLPGKSYSAGLAVNASGMVAGYSGTPGGANSA